MNRAAGGRVRVEPLLQGSEGEDTLLGVAVEKGASGVTLRLTGEVDLSNTAALVSAISAHQESLRVLDLRKVTFIDGRGVRILIEATARVRAQGRRLPILPGTALLRLTNLLDKQDELDIATRR